MFLNLNYLSKFKPQNKLKLSKSEFQLDFIEDRIAVPTDSRESNPLSTSVKEQNVVTSWPQRHFFNPKQWETYKNTIQKRYH